ncbi:MAG: extracellular solute-binding protein [Chloroflexi bacterium]|nr:extracellular solute-binding protein [Chloroflexota bacterium]
MSAKFMSRRQLLKGAGVAIAGASAAALAACQPKVVEVTRVVKETVVVKGEEKVVEKVVKETVVQEKVVEKTVVVEKAAEVKILRIHWRLGGVRPHYKDVMAEMEQTFPGVKMNSEEFPAGSAEFGPKVGAMISAGVAGDIVWCAIGSGSFQFFAAYNALAALDEFIAIDKSGFTLDAYFPRVVAAMRMGPEGQGSGNLYAIPEVAHGTYQCLFSNNDLLQQLGLPLPPRDDSWSREDLLDVALKATSEADRRFGFLPTTGGYSEIRHTTLAFGGELMSDDGKKSLIESEGVKAGTRWLHDCFFKHHVAPLPAEQTGGSSQMFLGGRLAMFQSGTWGLETMKSLVKDRFKWDMILIPKGPAGVRGGHLHADGFGVLAASKYKDLAYEFCKMITNEKYVRRYAVEVNGLTARFDTYEDPKAREAQPFWKEIKQSIEEADEHLGPANLRKQESQTLIKALFDPLWVGDEQPDDAWFAKTSAEWQNFLDKPRE